MKTGNKSSWDCGNGMGIIAKTCLLNYLLEKGKEMELLKIGAGISVIH